MIGRQEVECRVHQLQRVVVKGGGFVKLVMGLKRFDVFEFVTWGI